MVHYNLYKYIGYSVIIAGFAMKFTLIAMRIRAADKEKLAKQKLDKTGAK